MWAFVRFVYNIVIAERRGAMYANLLESTIASKEVKWAEFKGFAKIARKETLSKYGARLVLNYDEEKVREMFEKKFAKELEDLTILKNKHTTMNNIKRRLKNLLFSQLPSPIKNIYWYASDGVLNNLLYNYVKWPLLEGWKPAILRNYESYRAKSNKILQDLERKENSLAFKWNKKLLELSVNPHYTSDIQKHGDIESEKFQANWQGQNELKSIEEAWVNTNQKVLQLRRELTIEEWEEAINLKLQKSFEKEEEARLDGEWKSFLKDVNNKVKKQLNELNQKEIDKLVAKLTNPNVLNKNKINALCILLSIGYDNFKLLFYPTDTTIGNWKYRSGNFRRHYATWNPITESMKVYIRSEFNGRWKGKVKSYDFENITPIKIIDILSTKSFGRLFHSDFISI